MAQFECRGDAPRRGGGIGAAGDRPADHQDIGAVIDCRPGVAIRFWSWTSASADGCQERR